MRKLAYYIATSIDGFIAAPDGDGTVYPISEGFTRFTAAEYPETLPTHVRALLGIENAENVRFDTVVMGRRTYDPALQIDITSPYAHLRQYVFSRSLTESPDPAVEIVSGDAVAKVRELKAEDGGLDIYLCGGADLAGQLRDEIDELLVKTYPVVLGEGIPMFSPEFGALGFEMTGHRAFDDGLIFATYTRKR
ncbi:dihydrofolate reductase family protein [Streptomyces sp. NBC_00829]|uniref:dihydrofolate reductase family protein n=1 Tax=Streptomyces sp. NBC_00829 TaxID=2903679 RepID=UPI0038678C29|nr:dihydrofolate reductase family protein [Streptomyces sp. NBC_00829]